MPTYRLINRASGEIRESENLAALLRARDREYADYRVWRARMGYPYPAFTLESFGTPELLPASVPTNAVVQQLSLFANGVTVLASTGVPIELGLGVSDCCETEREIHTFTRYVSEWSAERDYRELARIGASYVASGAYGSGVTLSCSLAYCPSCEHVCECCDMPSGERFDTSICSNCETCSECCECSYCEDCCEPVSELAACSRISERYHCADCCECDRCDYCERYLSRGEYPCENSSYCETCCERYCSYCHPEEEECEDDYYADSREIERVATFDPTGLLRNGNRTFGVELEVSGIGVGRAANIVRSTGLECWNRGYTHSVSETDWKSVEDGSTGVSAEIVSPILRGEHGLEQLRVVMLALKANGATVEHGTGAHVHYGVSDLSGKQLARVMRFYLESANAIDSIHSPSRRSEYYCSRSREYEIERIDATETDSETKQVARDTDRYRAVNVNAYAKYGTLEFRQHRGTLNYRKLSAWIAFCDALISAAIDGAKPSHSIGVLLLTLKRYGLSEQHASYLLERAETLAS